MFCIMPPDLIERFFEYSPGTYIRYVITGEGDITVLLLHGFAASIETWKDIEPLLRHRWRLIEVDMKGFGLSSKPRDHAYTIFDHAAVITALVRHLGLSDYVLLGHSYGGLVGLTVYLTSSQLGSPSAIRSLVLIDAPCYPQNLPFSMAVLRTSVLNRLLQSVTTAHFRASYMLNHIFRDKARVTAERIDRYARYFDLPGSHEAMISSARQIIPDEPARLTSRIGEVRVPTLIIWGENDPLIHLWQAERLHKEIKDARLEVLRNCGHVPHEERPEDVARVLGDFIC